MSYYLKLFTKTVESEESFRNLKQVQLSNTSGLVLAWMVETHMFIAMQPYIQHKSPLLLW